MNRGQIMTRYDFLESRWVILSNVWIDLTNLWPGCATITGCTNECQPQPDGDATTTSWPLQPGMHEPGESVTMHHQLASRILKIVIPGIILCHHTWTIRGLVDICSGNGSWINTWHQEQFNNIYLIHRVLGSIPWERYLSLGTLHHSTHSTKRRGRLSPRE